MTRIAAIDIGTNSVLLTVAEVRQHGGGHSLSPVVERARITRLGEGVDRSRRLNRAASERTLTCLREYAVEIGSAGAVDLDVVGTSALRDAGGGPEFVDMAAEILGVRPRVISGSEEAELTFEGALSGLAVEGELSVFDVGGGSTEVIHGLLSAAPGRTRHRVDAAVSLDVGSVRLFERHARRDPPGEQELASARDDIDRALESAPRPRTDRMLVGVAGTVTTLAAIDQELASYDPARVHGARLERARIAALYERLSRMTLEARRALPGLEPARADVIVFGALIVRSVVDWAGAAGLVVSDRGVRWGLLERRAARMVQASR